MSRTPDLTNREQLLRRSGYQALQPTSTPAYWGVDLDPARRPGVPMAREPQPWPNTRFPPERQLGPPASPMHGRTNKELPPVFGTAVPLHGLSGAVRKLAYRYPDHKPRHWLLMMLGDRVDSWTYRARRYWPLALPVAVVGLLSRRPSRPSPAR